MSIPAHTVLSVHQFLTKNDMILMPHPLYSCDLALSGFCFVSPDEKFFQRERFANVEELKPKKGRSTKKASKWV